MNKVVSDSLLRGLACAALEPGLRQVLLFDADFVVLETAVSNLQQMLQLTTRQDVQVVHLPGTAQDDDLWGGYIPDHSEVTDSKNWRGMTVTWQEGWVTQNRQSEDWLLVVIPDLSLLSLPVTRTYIVLMDTTVAHLQRHGQDEKWTPRICWLAACPRKAVGKVSLHLMDRFSLRLSASPTTQSREPKDIVTWLKNDSMSLAHFAENSDLPDAWRERLEQVSTVPELSTEAGQRIVVYSKDQNHSGLRRELALARIGRGLARLMRETVISSHHVDEAANLIGLSLTLPLPEPQPELESPPLEPPPTEPFSSELPPPSLPDDPLFPSVSQMPAPISLEQVASEDTIILPPIQLPPSNPYPEDTAPINREQFALQFPLRRRVSHISEHGVIVGVQSADTVQDLALFATILEAALYQRIRHINHPKLTDRFILSSSDMRRYRRMPQPDTMLLLLLDYTSLEDCEWQEALIPHLSWAYVNRASITVIQVGSNRTEDELKATKVTARSLLTPRIADTLESQPGRASPLAHGLELAYQTIQKAHQHGRSFVQYTRMVIVTDGRGNVPLEASFSGQVKMPVNREGIEDALHIASQFREMKRLEPVLLDPQPYYLSDLPHALAKMMDAQHEIIPLVEEAQLWAS